MVVTFQLQPWEKEHVKYVFGEFTDFSANKGNMLGEAMRKTNDQKSRFLVSTECQKSSLAFMIFRKFSHD